MKNDRKIEMAAATTTERPVHALALTPP